MTMKAYPPASKFLYESLADGIGTTGNRAGRVMNAQSNDFESLSPADLLRARWSGDINHDYSPLGENPVILLDLETGDPGAERETLALVRSLPVPVIGIGTAESELALACDTVVPGLPDAAPLVASCRHAPQAAMTLAQVLRVTEPLAPRDALVVESLAFGVLQGGQEHRRWRQERGPASPAPVPVADHPLELQRDDDTLEIVLNRPDRQNEMDAAMRHGLVEAIRLGGIDESVALLRLRATGRHFSTGGALHEFGTVSDGATGHALRSLQSPAQELLRCNAEIEVFIRGACLGAGLEIAAFAHRIEADRSAFFQLPELRMGLIPGAGGCVSLPRRIGRQRTAWLVLSGKRISARTALSWGLIDRIGTP